MQHPDEGKIHSWLDAALPADEAASMESHVAACPSCAAAIAEARGFIAASSRILTALDDVPRGVLPVAPARKRDFRVVWRVAAAMLVVAGGSFVVMREGGQDAPVASDGQETAVLTQTLPDPPMVRAGKGAASAEKDLSREPSLRRVSGGSAGGMTAEGVATDAVASTSAVMRLPANAVGAESEDTPLKVLRIERMTGSRRTIYEIAPSQTVTLTEPESLQLSGIVVTGAQPAKQRQSTASGARAAQPMRTEAAPAAAFQAGAALAASENTISWTESPTGKTLTLSGNLPVERLQEIRRRIEKERAASKKKIP